MNLEEVETDIEVWPDNGQAVDVFVAMMSQWRVGYAGATGLDYNVLPFVMRMNGVSAADRPDVFESVRILEQSALEAMRKKE